MSEPARSLWRRLRSRRLAVGLILALAAYSALATAVPPDATPSWAAHPAIRLLGSERPFASPLFLLLAAALTLSTSACSWERTAAALRRARGLGIVTPGALRCLRAAPALPVPASAGPGETLQRAEEALRGLRLRTKRGPRMVEAVAGRAGLLGSPLFHWSLTMLFVVLAFGRLTRAEGQMGVPVGGWREDVRESYGILDEGPLHGADSGVRVGVTEFTADFTDEHGVSRGPAPVVRLSRGGEVFAEQRVYPNRPLRHGSFMVHSTDGYGLSAWISVEGPEGETIDSVQTISDFDTARPSGTSPTVLSLTVGGEELTVRVSPVARAVWLGERRTLSRELPRSPRLSVHISPSRESASRDVEIGPGEAVGLPGGYRLRFERLTHYARLSVVDDWSVAPIYALFGTAAAGLALALLVPFRSVRLLLSEDGREMHAEVAHAHRDAAFQERVGEALKRVTEGSSTRGPSRPTSAEETPGEPMREEAL
ncbi:MAG: cytochrome c biogenesis protein ResB [Coriobacteriia bacterium]|nr:cytochrome c biogenesis protein ResB [Coriobacteriia bacterium]